MFPRKIHQYTEEDRADREEIPNCGAPWGDAEMIRFARRKRLYSDGRMNIAWRLITCDRLYAIDRIRSNVGVRSTRLRSDLFIPHVAINLRNTAYGSRARIPPSIIIFS